MENEVGDDKEVEGMDATQVVAQVDADLIEGVQFAGAPAFLDFAGEADVQLFI